MSHVKAVKQRVCLAIFTVGLSLAAFVEISCTPDHDQMANTPLSKVEHVVIVKS